MNNKEIISKIYEIIKNPNSYKEEYKSQVNLTNIQKEELEQEKIREEKLKNHPFTGNLRPVVTFRNPQQPEAWDRNAGYIPLNKKGQKESMKSNPTECKHR